MSSRTSASRAWAWKASRRRSGGADPQAVQLASADQHGERTVLEIDGRKIGGEHFALIAGPCTVESRDTLLETARSSATPGDAVRGGAYKPRTSPYAFQGLGQEGCACWRGQAGDRHAIVTGADGRARPGRRVEVADVIQIGARTCRTTRCWPRSAARTPGAAQARPVGATGRAADGGRVHLSRRQPRAPLRARIRTFDTDHRRRRSNLMRSRSSRSSRTCL